MCAHEITDRCGGRPVTPGSSDRFYSQLLLLPPCLNSVFSPLRKGRKFSQITTSHMASASSASMVSRWVSLVTCGLLRVGNGGLMRELWYSGLYPYSLQENEAFTKTPCYHYFHCHCLARYIQHMEHELQAQGQEQEQERQHAATKQVGPPDCLHLTPLTNNLSSPSSPGAVNLLMVMSEHSLLFRNRHACAFCPSARQIRLAEWLGSWWSPWAVKQGCGFLLSF